jgi:hypothetical protein
VASNKIVSSQRSSKKAKSAKRTHPMKEQKELDTVPVGVVSAIEAEADEAILNQRLNRDRPSEGARDSSTSP